MVKKMGLCQNGVGRMFVFYARKDGLIKDFPVSSSSGSPGLIGAEKGVKDADGRWFSHNAEYFINTFLRPLCM